MAEIVGKCSRCGGDILDVIDSLTLEHKLICVGICRAKKAKLPIINMDESTDTKQLLLD